MSTTATRRVYVNLPVKDLDRSVRFFTQLGFEFDQQFTDENASAMVVNDSTSVMLLVEDFFKGFTKKGLVDATTQTEAIIALSADSRAEVDELVNKALAAGGSKANDPMDEGPMYGWSFQDPDGHLWEVMHMDMSAMEQE